MSKIEKLLKKLQNKPIPSDFTWEELIKVLKYLGFNIISTGKTGGSRRKFINDNNIVINLHQPHPNNNLKRYQIEQILELLKKENYL